MLNNNPVPNGEHRKGRYWNYEEDRWSYCSDDDDDESEAAKVGTKTGQNTTTNKQNTVLEAAAAVAEVAAEDEDGSEPESEWEYFYEDAELKKTDVLPEYTGIPSRFLNLSKQ